MSIIPMRDRRWPTCCGGLANPKVGSSPDHLRWIWLHYTYPTATTDELLQVMAESPRVVRYIDCPLQHIDDKLLKLMRRGYTGKSVAVMVERAKTPARTVFAHGVYR